MKTLACLALLTVIASGCSEYDSPTAPPPGGPADTTATVLLWSQPRAATVEISRIEAGGLVPFGIESTPIERTLPTGSYAFRFTKVGYTIRHQAVLLGPGVYETVGVELDSILTPPPPAPRPTVTITVTPEITEGETVEINVTSTNAEFGFIAPVGIFTTGGNYADEPFRTGTLVYTYAAFGPGGIAVAADTVIVNPRPAPAPWLTFEGQPLRVTVGQFGNLVWSANADHVRIDGPLINPGNRGAIGILPVRFDEPGVYRYTATSYDAADRPVLTAVVAIEATSEPTAPPDSLVLTIPVDAGVTTLEGDQIETIIDVLALPPNVEIRVAAELEYSGDQPDQRNEAAAIGFHSPAGTVWALIDGADCPVIPDQAGIVGRTWVEAGIVRGVTTGSVVFSHAIRHDCGGRFNGRESVYIRTLRLVVYLR